MSTQHVTQHVVNQQTWIHRVSTPDEYHMFGTTVHCLKSPLSFPHPLVKYAYVSARMHFLNKWPVTMKCCFQEQILDCIYTISTTDISYSCGFFLTLKEKVKSTSTSSQLLFIGVSLREPHTSKFNGGFFYI